MLLVQEYYVGNGDGKTPLHYAAEYWKEEVAKLLIDAGSDINKGDKDGKTPLHYAARYGKEDVAKVIIEAGADINKGNGDGNSPLHYAARYGEEDVAKVLIEAGADINKGSKRGSTPLHHAAGEGKDNQAKLLIDAGADSNKGNIDGQTPLHLAIGKGQVSVALRIIEAGADLKYVNVDKLLHKAAIHGHDNAAKFLIKAGADLNKGDKDGNMPLHLAVKNDNKDVALILIDAGADLNKGDGQGKTPLHLAVTNDNKDVAIKLIDAGADLNMGDGQGETPLHLAVTNVYKNMAMILIDAGSDLKEYTNVLKNLLLHWSAWTNTENAAKLLILAGADVNNHDSDGESNKFRWTPLHVAAKVGHKNVAIVLINAGANIELGDEEKKTPLHWAAMEGQDKCAELLTNAGADILKTDINEYNPMNLALMKGHVKVADVLVDALSHQLSKASKDKDHRTFESILINIPPDKIHNALLIVNRKDSDTVRKTPIGWALVNKDKGIVSLILQKEHEFHRHDKAEGLQCLQSQLTHDEDLKSIIKQFTDLYNKTRKEKFVAGLLAIIPVTISFGFYFFDVYSDGTLSSDYYEKSQNFSLPLQNSTNCTDLQLISDDYKVAFTTNILLIIVAIVPSYFIVLSRSLATINWKNHEGSFFRFSQDDRDAWVSRHKTMSALCLLFVTSIGIITSPIFLFVTYMVLRVWHSVAEKKGAAKMYLDVAEYYWGIVTKIECGIESSCQLILQLWLLAPTIVTNSSTLSPRGIVRGIVRGALFLSEDSTDRSMGKVFVALGTLTFSIGSSYMFDKKQSVSHFDMIPLHVSRLCQVAARILALVIFFSVQRDFASWFPVLFLIHSTFVFLIKLTCNKDWPKSKIGLFKKLIYIMTSCAASSLVHIDFKTMTDDVKKTVDGFMGTLEQDHEKEELNRVEIINRIHETTNGKDYKQQKKPGTFTLHFYFMLLVLIENLLLSVSPFIIGIDIKITRCLGQEYPEWIFWSPFIIFGLWTIGCLSQIFFYKAFHPWSEINGANWTQLLGCCLSLYKSCKKANDADPTEDVEMNMMGNATDPEGEVEKRDVNLAEDEESKKPNEQTPMLE